MSSDNVFKIMSSTDGDLWEHAPDLDSSSYSQIFKIAKDRSVASKKIQRVVRIDTGAVLIAFSCGRADTAYYTPTR